jgi:hypothetical protein
VTFVTTVCCAAFAICAIATVVYVSRCYVEVPPETLLIRTTGTRRVVFRRGKVLIISPFQSSVSVPLIKEDISVTVGSTNTDDTSSVYGSIDITVETRQDVDSLLRFASSVRFEKDASQTLSERNPVIGRKCAGVINRIIQGVPLEEITQEEFQIPIINELNLRALSGCGLQAISLNCECLKTPVPEISGSPVDDGQRVEELRLRNQQKIDEAQSQNQSRIEEMMQLTENRRSAIATTAEQIIAGETDRSDRQSMQNEDAKQIRHDVERGLAKQRDSVLALAQKETDRQRSLEEEKRVKLTEHGRQQNKAIADQIALETEANTNEQKIRMADSEKRESNALSEIDKHRKKSLQQVAAASQNEESLDARDAKQRLKSLDNKLDETRNSARNARLRADSVRGSGSGDE